MKDYYLEYPVGHKEPVKLVETGQPLNPRSSYYQILLAEDGEVCNHTTLADALEEIEHLNRKRFAAE